MKKDEDSVIELVDSDEEVKKEVVEEKQPRVRKTKKTIPNDTKPVKPAKKSGLNYTAIIIMIIMFTPALFALLTNVSPFYLQMILDSHFF